MLVRPGLERIPTYSPSELAGVDLDLRDNLNLWGAPPAACGVLRALTPSRVAEYPRVSAGALVDALAASIGVRSDEIVAGCGSDDVIDSFLRAVASPGDRVAHADPSFSMVPVFARLSGLEPVGVPLLPNGAADVDGLLATGARVIYLCSPNNPTGTVTPAAEIRRLIAQAPGVVLVDEAYAEFTDEPDWRAEAPAMEKVLVTRTFSKAWGMAGLRVGYGVGSRTLTAAVTKARGPYKVNALGELAAVTALREDGGWMRAAAAAARDARTRLVAAFAGRTGVRPWDSRGNFVFVGTDGPAADLAARFQARGIGVRAFSGLTGIGEALRLGVAPAPQLDRVIRAVGEMWP